MQKYSLEFILNAYECSIQAIKNALCEFSETLEVSQDSPAIDSNSFKINITTDEPTVIFDACSVIGRISSVKIDEI
jgi:dihydroxyacetone kinase-like predicted kinase